MVITYLHHFPEAIIDNNNVFLLSDYKTSLKLVIEPKKEVMTKDGLTLSLLPSSVVMLLPQRWHCAFIQKTFVVTATLALRFSTKEYLLS